ncbi:MAG: hypothetical protein ACJA0H_002531, partial [Francisellaceae bacterium]
FVTMDDDIPRAQKNQCFQQQGNTLESVIYLCFLSLTPKPIA